MYFKYDTRRLTFFFFNNWSTIVITLLCTVYQLAYFHEICQLWSLKNIYLVKRCYQHDITFSTIKYVSK